MLAKAPAMRNALLHQEIEDHADELENLVNERTVELTSAHKSLAENEHKFRNVVSQSLDGIFLTDEDGIVIEWNTAIAQITGISEEQALGQPIWDIRFNLKPFNQHQPVKQNEICW